MESSYPKITQELNTSILIWSVKQTLLIHQFYEIGISVKDVNAPIATAHRYCTRKFTCHVIHRARTLSNKMKYRKDGHCYSFAWI